MSAREALQYSLNVPAVAVLDRLGPAPFTAALAAAGIRLKLPQPGSEPGLAVALGGDGISLHDLATLYVALSHDGAVAPLRTRPDAPQGRRPRSSARSPPGTSTISCASAPPPPGMLPGEVRRAASSRSRPAPPTGSATPGRSATTASDDRGLGRAARRDADAGDHRPHHRGAGLFKIADLLGPPPAADQTEPPPPGALLVARRDLPPRLQRLDPGPAERAGRMPAARKSSTRRTARRSNGTARTCRSKRLAARAAALARRRQAAAAGPAAPDAVLAPVGIGFTRLTVIDAAGRSAHATVRLEP